MLVPNRNFSSPEYRYGFQGQEKDDEIKGGGNSINYKFRMHDPRVGRFFAVDPLAGKYPWNSPYAFSENRVIDGTELEGLERERIREWHVMFDKTNGTYNTIQTSEKVYKVNVEWSGERVHNIYILHDSGGNQFATVDQANYVRNVRKFVTKEIYLNGTALDLSKMDIGEGTMWSNQDKSIKYDEDSPNSTAKNHVWDVDMDEFNSYMSKGKGKGKIKLKKNAKIVKGEIDKFNKLYDLVKKTEELVEIAKTPKTFVMTVPYVSNVNINLDNKTFERSISYFTIRGNSENVKRLQDSLNDVTNSNLEFGNNYIKNLKDEK